MPWRQDRGQRHQAADCPPADVGCIVMKLFNRFPRTSVERGMRTSQPSRSRWQIAAGLSGIDTMDRRSERRDYRNRNDGSEYDQSHMRTPPVAPVEIVVHGQHLRERGSTQLPRAGSGRSSDGPDAPTATSASKRRQPKSDDSKVTAILSQELPANIFAPIVNWITFTGGIPGQCLLTGWREPI
jgi:hypothetical protein